MAFCEKSHSLKCAPYSLLSFFFTAQGGNRASSRGGQVRIVRQGDWNCALGYLQLARSPAFCLASAGHGKHTARMGCYVPIWKQHG